MSYDHERETSSRESVSLRNLRDTAKSRSESKIALVALVALAYHLVPRLESLPDAPGSTEVIRAQLTLPGFAGQGKIRTIYPIVFVLKAGYTIYGHCLNYQKSIVQS